MCFLTSLRVSLSAPALLARALLLTWILPVLMATMGMIGVGFLAEAYALDTLNQQQKNINRIQKSISVQELQVENARQAEGTILDDLAKLDHTIEQQKKKIATLQDNIQDQEYKIALKNIEVRATEKKRQRVQKHLEKRLFVLYARGKTGFLDVSFSSKNLPELLLFADAFEHLITYDRAVFFQYREILDKAEQAKKAHELEKGVLENFLVQAELDQQDLENLLAEKQTMLTQVRSQKGLYEQAVKEMKKVESRLTASLLRKKKKEYDRSQRFLRSKGTLPRPVAGRVTRKFQAPGLGQSDSRDQDSFAKGITIVPSEKAAVIAVQDGQVLHGRYIPGYGKALIIDHGFGYYTITARLDQLKVKKGAKVKKGEVIAYTGATTTLFGKGMYFEIRHNTRSLDPLDWLKPDAYP